MTKKVQSNLSTKLTVRTPRNVPARAVSWPDNPFQVLVMMMTKMTVIMMVKYKKNVGGESFSTVLCVARLEMVGALLGQYQFTGRAVHTCTSRVIGISKIYSEKKSHIAHYHSIKS